ncbi:MAG: glutaredoxin family protein [Deltaproteobacteria bacterium]|nr:glutaredoxin family protein [Deltaproteobacteria bacterium]MBN2671469.1 glutaredoxin family protein [Deltaproteobacteria bacterium]
MVSCDESDTRKADTKPSSDGAAGKVTTPVVTDSTPKLLFSWFEENTAKTAVSIDEIPDNVKKEVRVQDLSIPPEKRDPSWIFLADLTLKNAAGRYAVRAVERDKYEAKRHPAQTQTAQKADNSSQVSVVMYSTPHCPHCKRARRWLLEQKIQYKEVNVEENEQAAAALAQKGLAQGAPTSGVPMFEINGHLVPGFDPTAIKNALSLPPLYNSPAPPRTQPVPPASPSPIPPSSVTI